MKCKATKKDGSACTADAQPSGWCVFHDPAREPERASRKRAGGLARQKKAKDAAVAAAAAAAAAKAKAEKAEQIAAVPLVVPKTAQEWMAFLSEAAASARGVGPIDSKQAHAVAAIAQVVPKLIEVGDLLTELKELKEMQRERNSRSAGTLPGNAGGNGNGRPAGSDPLPELPP